MMPRKFIYKLFLMFLGQCVQLKAQLPVTPPTPYTGDGKTNYVRTWKASAAQTDPNTLIAAPVKEVKQSTQYHDGLGRPLQTVVKQGSLVTNTTTPTSAATAMDMVSAVVYDEFGREQYQYLPFAANNTSGTGADGAFKLNPFQQQATFSAAKYSGETWFYGMMQYEPSPLNRVSKTMAPGESWVKAGRGVSITYEMNVADEVKKWSIAATGIVLPTVGSSDYDAGQLTRIVTTDEAGKRTVEYKDKNGLMILKKVEIQTNPGAPSLSSHTGWLCTYYVYDDYGNLRFVISPKAVDAITGSWSLGTNFASSTLAKELCFIYEYDDRNRIIIKKVPGAGEVHIVYDARDRVVLTQDAQQRFNGKWSYIQYDELNRPVATGIWTNTQSRTTHAAAAATSTSYPVMNSADAEELTRTFYDDYSWRASYGNPLVGSFSAAHNSYFDPEDNVNWPYLQKPTTHSVATRGLVTGTKVKLLNTSTYLFTVNFYDDKGRIIQVHSTNAAGGHDVVTTQYSWDGKPLRIVQQQEILSSPQTHIIVSKFSYDELGRQVSISQSVNSTMGTVSVNKAEQVLAKYEYDELGQLKTKKLGIKPGTTSTPLETLVYDYNIRGWMLGANRDYIKESGESGYQPHWFGFELNYDRDGYTSTLNKQYNGNIGSTIWKSAGDEQQRKIDFAYDPANRLLRGDYVQKHGTSWDVSDGFNFSIQMGDGLDGTTAYDANGNIQAMKQIGFKITGASSPIDDLQYTYFPNTNRLQRVDDAQNYEQTKLGDFHYTAANKTSTDYDYDVYTGNLVSDKNKYITSIVYNHLNLPEVINLNRNSQTQQVKYYYDALGNKYKKEVLEPSLSLQTGTFYIGNAVYKAPGTGSTSSAPELQFFQHAEGRLRFEPVIQSNAIIGGSFYYDYFVKDHLGNVRMVLTEQQQQDVYPAATLEGSLSNPGDAVSFENGFYLIDPAKVKPSSNATGITSYQNNNGNPPYNNNPYSNTTANSAKLYELKATSAGGVSGLGITLKVMSGDRIDIFGKSYYFNNNNQNNYGIPVLDILTGLLGAPSGAAAGKGVVAGDLNLIPAVTGGIGSFLTHTDRGSGTVPKAYINWILLDENFHYVDGKFSRVGSAGTLTDHGSDPKLQNISVTKNGYLYVYCSNESPVEVYFDNLQVIHTRGALLEESHYYAWGLEMAAISSKSAGKVENKYKFGGQELQSDEFSSSGLDLYDNNARMYDHQIGRFHSIDPLASQFNSWSPYMYSYNNPIRFGDPTGMSANDWVQKNGQMMWDDRVKDAGTAVKYYGEGAVYRAPGYSYNSSKGSVTLGENRQFTLNGVNQRAVDHTPGWGDRMAYEVINWFATSDFVIEGKAKFSVGAQLGASGNINTLEGKIEGGALTYDLGELSYDITELDGEAKSGKLAHNFVGAEGKLFSDKLKLGFKVDYAYDYYNSYSGPKMVEGTGNLEGNFYIPFKTFGPKVKLTEKIAPQLKASGMAQSAGGKEFYGIDIGASLRAVLGIELKLKIGVNR